MKALGLCILATSTVGCAAPAANKAGPGLAPDRGAGAHVSDSQGSGATCLFELSVGGNVEVRILSLDGKKMRTLQCGHLESGNHQIRWDGLDDAGRPVPGGLYIYEAHLDGKKVKQDRVLLAIPED